MDLWAVGGQLVKVDRVGGTVEIKRRAGAILSFSICKSSDLLSVKSQKQFGKKPTEYNLSPAWPS